MYIVKRKYTDYNGVEREEEFCFHLNKKEMTEFVLTDGEYTLDQVIEQLGKERNNKKIMEIFDDLIKRSYGQKSLDGRRFIKNEEILNDFTQTEAYSDFFLELCSNAKTAADFINGIVPKEVAEEMIKAAKENSDAIPPELREYLAKK